MLSALTRPSFSPDSAIFFPWLGHLFPNRGAGSRHGHLNFTIMSSWHDCLLVGAIFARLTVQTYLGRADGPFFCNNQQQCGIHVRAGEPAGAGKLRVRAGAPVIEVPLSDLLLCLPTRKDSVRVSIRALDPKC